MSSKIAQILKSPSSQVFIASWLAYAGFYFCRKNFSIAMPMLTSDMGMTKLQIANIIAVYSFVYMAGQFINGFLSDRFGSKRIVTYGLLMAVASNLLMGFAWGAWTFTGLMIINGYGQSTGWSGLVKMMSDWFKQEIRGIVMSWWTTCYVVGGFLAVIFATWWGTNHVVLSQYTWHRIFWAPALLLAMLAFVFIRLARDKNGNKTVVSPRQEKTKAFSWNLIQGSVKDTVSSTAVWVTAFMYFGVKFIRYTFLFWLPLYLTQAFGYTNEVAGYTSSVFEAAGFIGVILSGYMSDKLYKSRRFPVGALFLIALTAILFVQPLFAHLGYWGNVAAVGLVGLFTYGPDALMSGAAAQDLGKENAGTAAGIINGVGSVGQIISPYAVAIVTENFGWHALFQVFVIVAAISALLLITQWNHGRTPQPDKLHEEFEIVSI